MKYGVELPDTDLLGQTYCRGFTVPMVYYHQRHNLVLVHQRLSFIHQMYEGCVIYSFSEIPIIHNTCTCCMHILVAVLLFPLLQCCCTERHSTVGIQCDKWVYKKSGAARDTPEITFYTWDFAGQVGLLSSLVDIQNERHGL